MSWVIFLVFASFKLQAHAESKKIVGLIAGTQGKIAWLERASKKFKTTAKPDIADEIEAGDILVLEKNSSIDLLYFAGCRKETVAGPNKLKVLASRSEVSEKGKLSFRQIKCEPPKAAASEGSSSVPGALVLMGAKSKKTERIIPKPNLEIESEFKKSLEKSPADPALAPKDEKTPGL